MRLSEIGPAQIGAREVGFVQPGINTIGAFQVRAGKVGFRKVLTLEVGAL